MKIFSRCAKAFRAFALLSLFAVSLPVQAASFSFTGNFIQDDDLQFFGFTLLSDATVTIRTHSYGGGVNAEGESIPVGGFDTFVTLFGADGGFLAWNDDGPQDEVIVDPATGKDLDSWIQAPLAAGEYFVVLTQYDNTPSAPAYDLSSPFSHEGEGNFTGAFCGGEAFFDAYCNQRTSFWALDILDVDTAVAVVPLPPAIYLLIAPLLGLLRFRRRASR